MKRITLAVAVFAAAALAGCAATEQARSVQTNGFLAPYRSLLRPGKRGSEALLMYRNPDADWAAYDKILLEPVMVWNGPNSDLTAEQLKDLQQLADSFYVTLYGKLSQDYRMVQTADANTLRIQIAISHGEPSHTALLVASKVILPLKLANATWSFVSGKPVFTGQVTVEAVVKNARTGQLLGVGADRRVGGVKLFEKNVFSSWGDVKNSLQFYAGAAVWRLCVLRGGKDCVKPKA